MKGIQHYKTEQVDFHSREVEFLSVNLELLIKTSFYKFVCVDRFCGATQK